MKNTLIIGVALLVAGLVGGYLYGSKSAFQSAYDRAVADIKSQQELAAKKASEEAAKAANPFKVENPLEGVEANPFSKAQKALNPFAEE